MADDKGYKDTKEFTCTGCGKKIILTKFASQKTCKCDECKANNVPINPQIVEEALKNNGPKVRQKSEGATKICNCINCGKPTEVSKFMSASKVLCDACKGTAVATDKYPQMKIDSSKFGSIKLAPIEEYEMNEGVIANPRMKNVVCPSCGHQYMKPLMIIDWSQFGLIVHYQCTECYTTSVVSEQSRSLFKRYTPGKQFDYTGVQVKDLGMSWRDNSRIANALCILIEKCEQNNINIDEVFGEFSQTVPPYRNLNDRPVPSGFVIPEVDKWIYAVDEAQKLISSNAESLGENANIIADKLKELLKGDDKNE